MPNPDPIRLDADTWAIMRYVKDHPAAIVHRITDTAGEARFLVMGWHVDPAQRRMTSIQTTLAAADASVRWGDGPIKAAQRSRNGPLNGAVEQP